MRILFWIPYPSEGASNRYRVEQYLPYLRKEGAVCYLHSFWGSSAYKILYKDGHYIKKIVFFLCGVISRIIDILVIFRYDIVFIHREACPIGGAFFETILFILKKPIIFDFDDAIFISSSSRPNNFIEKFKSPKKIVSIIKKSAYVIAGNNYLSEFALRYNKSVAVIPTPINTDKFFPSARSINREIVVGWIGSNTTLSFLNQMEGVFSHLSEKFTNLRFKIVGGNFSNNRSNLTSKPWSLNEEIEDLKSFDIGIMPMPDDNWTKGKCGFKAILYMSMGIPCVCSLVGMNKEIIIDGINGFLASDDKEWINKLSMLIRDPELRMKIGMSGRRSIEDKYSLKVNAPKFLEVINKVYADRGKLKT